MFDTALPEGSVASCSDPTAVQFQFVSFEVAPLADGGLRVSLAGTFLDEAVLEFIGEEIETVRVADIDEAVAAIRRGLIDALKAHREKEH